MIHRKRHLESTGVSSSTWISNEVSITNVSNLTQLENQVIDDVEYFVYSFRTQLSKSAIISTTVGVNHFLITSTYATTVAFGNDFVYDDTANTVSSGETVKACRNDVTQFNCASLYYGAISITVTLYIPCTAIRYIRLEITVPESLEYSDTVISGTYKAYYTYNTSRDVYTEEGLFIEDFPATGDGSTEVTEVFTFTKYGLTATADVVRKEGEQENCITCVVRCESSSTSYRVIYNTDDIEQMFVNGVEVTPSTTIKGYAGDVNVKFAFSDVTSFTKKFYACENTISFDLSKFDSSKLTRLDYAFCNCRTLESINLKGFNTSNVKYMFDMFANCYALAELDLSSFDTRNCTHFDEMFYSCKSLDSIDISTFDTSNQRYIDDMFSYCYSLTSIKLGKTSTTHYPSLGQWCYGIPSTGTVYVPSEYRTRWASLISELGSGWTVEEY
jgi:surface protein